jgi:hypothetical protein
MTGPEHYRRAEGHLDAAEHDLDAGRTSRAESRTFMAQVHATLALAAATAEVDAFRMAPADAWSAAFHGREHIPGGAS